jgi:hypothetical protein
MALVLTGVWIGSHQVMGGLAHSFPHDHTLSKLIIRERQVKAIGLRERDMYPEHMGFSNYQRTGN